MNRLDHILIRVDNLEKSVKDFRNAGFSVYLGTSHKDAHNAMVYFKDDSFIELVDSSKFPRMLVFLAKTRIINLLGSFYKRIGRYTLSKDTFLDYAIYSRNIEKQHDRAQNKVSRLHHLSRVDCFGQVLKWKLFVFKETYFPFVMSDYLPYKYPEMDADKHRNKVSGICQLNIETSSDLLKLQEHLLDVFQLPQKNIVLRDNTLEIITQNTSIKYIKGKTNKIIGIKLDHLTPSIESILSEYKLFLCAG